MKKNSSPSTYSNKKNFPREFYIALIVLLYIIILPPFVLFLYLISRLKADCFYLFALQSMMEPDGFIFVPYAYCLLPFSVLSLLWLLYSVSKYRTHDQIKKGQLPSPKKLFLYTCQADAGFSTDRVNIEGHSVEIGDNVTDLENSGWGAEFRRHKPPTSNYTLLGHLDWEDQDSMVFYDGYMWRGTPTYLLGIAIYLSIRPLCIINVVPLFFFVHLSGILLILGSAQK